MGGRRGAAPASRPRRRSSGASIEAGPARGHAGRRQPARHRRPWADSPQALIDLGGIGALVCIPAGILAAVLRYRRGTPVERKQLKWFGSVLVLAFSMFFAATLLPQPYGQWAWIVASASIGLVPVAIGIAILRYRLYEIDRIVSRTIACALVTGAARGGVRRDDRRAPGAARPVHRTTTRSRSRHPRSSPRRCSSRSGAGSSAPSTGASTGRASTPSGRSTRSGRTCATRWTSPRSTGGSSRPPMRRCSPTGPRSGCGGRARDRPIDGRAGRSAIVGRVRSCRRAPRRRRSVARPVRPASPCSSTARYAAVGALLVIRRPRNTIGWLLRRDRRSGSSGTTCSPDRGRRRPRRTARATWPTSSVRGSAAWAAYATFGGFLALTLLFPSGTCSGRATWRRARDPGPRARVAIAVIAAIAPDAQLQPGRRASRRSRSPTGFAVLP